MSNNIITGVDIGTSSVKIVSARKNPETLSFEVLAKIQRPVFGVRKGVVSDIDEVSGVIKECIKEIEVQINEKIDGVYVNANGSHISCTSSQGLVSVSRADQKISAEDIDRVIQAARAFPVSKNKEIIDVYPKEFIIDGERGIKDPLDMQGVRFEAEVLVVEGFSQYIKNTSQVILDSELQLYDVIINPLAAASSVVNLKDKERGVAVIDIGANTTSLAVFEEGNLLHLAVFPIGSNNITNDIAIGLRTDIDTAEEIKLTFSSCLAQKGDKKTEKVTAKESEEVVSFSRAILRKIVEARVSEVFDLIKADLEKISRNQKLPAGIILTGGGSELPGISELAKKEFKLPCRVGHPLNFTPEIIDPKFSVACGLVILGNELDDDETDGMLSGIGGKIKRFFKMFIP